MKSLLKIICIFTIIAGCQDLPHKFVYDNPLDNLNPVTHGDPFQLTAAIVDEQVKLTWQEVQQQTVVEYHVYRSIDRPENFMHIATTVKGDTTWIDTSISAGHTYWYLITAVDRQMNESSQSYVVPAHVDTEPVMYINEGAATTYNVNVKLTILAPNAVQMWISNYSDFSDGQWEAYTTLKTWQLPVEEGSRTIYVRVKYADGSISLPFCASIQLDLTSPPMVYVAAGEFIMGNPNTIGDLDESPQHTIYLDGYWIDQFEVTNEQYARFLSAGNGAHHHPSMKIISPENGMYLAVAGYEDHPVVCVSYTDALAYASWRGASLPTEAQWEKAARGYDARLYPWGNSLESNCANYWNSGDPFENAYLIKTTPVGFFNGIRFNGYQTKDCPSPFGVYDMAGNVWEWCLDWYDVNYYNYSSNSNPAGPGSGTNRVIRGGSWADDPYYIRTACRSHRFPFEVSEFVGFRCVR